MGNYEDMDNDGRGLFWGDEAVGGLLTDGIQPSLQNYIRGKVMAAYRRGVRDTYTLTQGGTPDLDEESSELLARLEKIVAEHQKRQRWYGCGTVVDNVASVIEQYEQTARGALVGCESVRNDMLSMLRSVVFVLETVVCDHLNHSQKNERIRGAMSVLEMHIQSLREERFNFHDSLWRRDRDLFRWSEGERNLRDKVRSLEHELEEYRKQEEPVSAPGEPF